MSARRASLLVDRSAGSEWNDGWAGFTDDLLVTRAKDGSHDAFGELARRYRPGAVRTAASIIGSDRAEDVVQDALILAYRALGMLQDPRRFPQWLGTITRYRAMRLGRKESRRSAGMVALDGLPSEPPARVVESAEHDASEVPRLEAALLKIPLGFAEVLRLHFLEGLPHQKIAEKLGISLSTSKWRCYRGKQLLRELLRAGDPATTRVDEACERCVRNDGVRCAEVFTDASAARTSRPAGLPSIEAAHRRAHTPQCRQAETSATAR